MDGTRLITAADAIDTLAAEVAEFANTASDAAFDVAERMGNVAKELRDIAGEDDSHGTLQAAPDEPHTGTAEVSTETTTSATGETPPEPATS